MTRDALRPDRELHDLLRCFDSPDRPTDAQRHALERRIATGAEPLLAARRGTPPTWWEFAATWARTLIPLGAATALVAAVVIFRTSRPTKSPLAPTISTQDSLVGAVPHDPTSRHLLDLLVTPSRAPRSPR
jgi:anti-sigma-K factor RskA